MSIAVQRARDRKDWRSAERIARDTLKTIGKLKEPARSNIEAQLQLQLASVLYRQGRMQDAEELFIRGTAKARASDCLPHAAQFFLEWGDLCLDEGRLYEAEQHYTTALEGDEARANPALQIFDLQRLGNCLLLQNRRDEAEDVINRAIVLETRVVHEQMIRDGKDPSQHHVISWSMPDLHFCRKQYHDAREIYQEKVAYWEKSVTRPDNIDLGHLQMRLAACEAKTGNMPEAIEMYSRAKCTFEREWCTGHPKAVAADEAKIALMVGSAS